MVIRSPNSAQTERLGENLTNRNAIGSLLVARVVYAINWYNITAVFASIAVEFRENVAGLGLIFSSFFLGIGVVQVPAGLIAARIGARRTAIVGVALASASALLSGLAVNIYELVLFRGLVGMGMAFVYAPAITLIAKYMRTGSTGLGVGLYNSVFQLGGAAGLFVWAILDELVGWRSSLVFSGALGLATVLLLMIFLPRQEDAESFQLSISGLRRTLLNKRILLISIILVGVNAANNLSSNFIVVYLEDVFNLSPTIATIFASLNLLAGLISAPFFGKAYDKVRNIRRLLFLSGVSMTAGIGAPFFAGIYGALLSPFFVGLATGAAFTVGTVAVRDSRGISPEYQTLAVSWTNGIALFGGSWSPALFSYVAVFYGYGLAWMTAALYTFMLTLPALALENHD